MKTNGQTKLPLKEQFEQAARSRRRNPDRMIEDFMRECLEIWEDQVLDEAIRRQAQASSYKESDAVKLVREVRGAKRQRRGKT